MEATLPLRPRAGDSPPRADGATVGRGKHRKTIGETWEKHGKIMFVDVFFGKHWLKSSENRHIMGTSARNIGFHGENHRFFWEFSSMHESFKLFQVAREKHQTTAGGFSRYV